MLSIFYSKLVAILIENQNRIGFSIAQRLAKEGAKVVISSRKQDKVDKALEQLRSDNLECHGLVCHVAKQSDRKNLVDEVIIIRYKILIT